MVRKSWRSTTSPPGAGEVGETASNAWLGEVGLSDRGCRRPLGGHVQRPCVCKTVGYSALWLEQAPLGGGCKGLAGLSQQRVTGNVQMALLEGHVHRLSTGL